MAEWLDADLAALPRHRGGLSLPNLRVEILALAAIVVGTWAHSATRQAHIVGDVLFNRKRFPVAPSVYITPGYVDQHPTHFDTSPHYGKQENYSSAWLGHRKESKNYLHF